MILLDLDIDMVRCFEKELLSIGTRTCKICWQCPSFSEWQNKAYIVCMQTPSELFDIKFAFTKHSIGHGIKI